MHNTIMILLAICSMTGTMKAQGLDRNTIKVQARAVYLDPTPTYKTTLSISGSNASYGFDIMNLEQMVATFKNAVLAEGLPWDHFKETPYNFGFETMGYEKEGVIFEYSTISAADIKKVLNLKTVGLRSLDAVSEITIDPKEARILNQMALANAKVKAEAMAWAMEKELGDIVYVEDHQNVIDIPYETALYYNRPAGEYIYYIYVVYEIE